VICPFTAVATHDCLYQVLWKRASTLEAEALLQESRDICDRAALMQGEAMKILDDIQTAQVLKRGKG
jgi:hypothetical protein